jgi:hypothetical protein
MLKSIESAVKSGHGNAVVYAGALGLIASDIIPTPADAVYFYGERKLKEKQLKGEITSSQYWGYESALYYGLNPLWWTAVLGVMVLTKGDYTKKLKIGAAIIAAGAVVGVIGKNITEEKKTYGK